MDAETLLRLLSLLGLSVGLAGGLVSQLTKTSAEVEGLLGTSHHAGMVGNRYLCFGFPRLVYIGDVESVTGSPAAQGC
jgi:hypothetical protein